MPEPLRTDLRAHLLHIVHNSGSFKLSLIASLPSRSLKERNFQPTLLSRLVKVLESRLLIRAKDRGDAGIAEHLTVGKSRSVVN